MRLSRTLLGLGGALSSALIASTLIPGCAVGYVMRSAYFQAELLASRKPIDTVRASGRLDTEQLDALDRIADIKAFGHEMGLAATHNYDTVALNWDRRIWNVTACQPLDFEAESWWFPVVGRVNYLGYFREQDARRQQAREQAKGLDVYVRTAGAYSTLGWFRDPILVPMLDWSTFRLADTVLHELTHATVWIPGSVQFNESFANFVGEQAAFRYLDSRYGPEAPITIEAHQRQEDSDRWRRLLHGVYRDLDTLYDDDSVGDTDKLHAKAQIFASLEQRVLAMGFHSPDAYLRAVSRGPWNNARMIQFRTYNQSQDHFATLLDDCDGDLLVFMDRIKALTAHTDAPFTAVEEAALAIPNTPSAEPTP